MPTADRPASTPNGRRPAPIPAGDLASVRTETTAASTLPARAYHDPDLLAWEQEQWFAGSWVCVGREEDLPHAGSFFRTAIAGEPLIVVRGNDGELRAFFNVCRHRGSLVVEEDAGQLVRFQCPYHAWIYDLDGTLHKPRFTENLVDFDPDEHGLAPVALAVWQGQIFLNLTEQPEPLEQSLGTLPAFFERFDLGALRRAERIDYDIQANWKIIIENYSECYHCPGVHPQLNKITPYDQGEWIAAEPEWTGSWMQVAGDYETLSLDGHTHGRAMLPGMTDEDAKRVYYFIVWPNLLMSLHPDYLMTHRIVPLAPGRTFVACEWFFDPAEIAKPDFDPSDAVGFWDLTNRQDWHVCELQQQGTGSRSFDKGRYSAFETGPHLFAARVADRYADDGRETAVTPIAKREQKTRRGAARAAGGAE
jgi:Rieske 2Fe-2S family protein